MRALFRSLPTRAPPRPHSKLWSSKCSQLSTYTTSGSGTLSSSLGPGHGHQRLATAHVHLPEVDEGPEVARVARARRRRPSPRSSRCRRGCRALMPPAVTVSTTLPEKPRGTASEPSRASRARPPPWCAPRRRRRPGRDLPPQVRRRGLEGRVPAAALARARPERHHQLAREVQHGVGDVGVWTRAGAGRDSASRSRKSSPRCWNSQRGGRRGAMAPGPIRRRPRGGRRRPRRGRRWTWSSRRRLGGARTTRARACRTRSG